MTFMIQVGVVPAASTGTFMAKRLAPWEIAVINE